MLLSRRSSFVRQLQLATASFPLIFRLPSCYFPRARKKRIVAYNSLRLTVRSWPSATPCPTYVARPRKENFPLGTFCDRARVIAPKLFRKKEHHSFFLIFPSSDRKKPTTRKVESIRPSTLFARLLGHLRCGIGVSDLFATFCTSGKYCKCGLFFHTLQLMPIASSSVWKRHGSLSRYNPNLAGSVRSQERMHLNWIFHRHHPEYTNQTANATSTSWSHRAAKR